MKKKFYIGLIAFICFGQLGYSQNNRFMEKVDGKTWHKIEVSEGLQISKIDNDRLGVSSYVTHKEIRNNPSPTGNNYNLTIHVLNAKVDDSGNPEWTLSIGNGLDPKDENYFCDLVWAFYLPDYTYKAVVPEGYYDIMIQTNFLVPDPIWEFVYMPAYLFIEQIYIGEDTELNADFEDAVHKIEIAPVDINNALMKDREMDFIDTRIILNVKMHYSIAVAATTYLNWSSSAGFWPSFCVYVNDMGTRNKIMIAVDAYETKAGDTYHLEMPVIDKGLTESIVLKNKSEDYVHFTQMYHISKELTEDPFPHYCNTRELTVLYDFETSLGHSYMGTEWFSPDRVYDKEKGYSLYTNVTNKEAPKTGDTHFFIAPLFYEFVEPLPPPFPFFARFFGTVAGNFMAIDKKGDLILNFHSNYFYFENFSFLKREQVLDNMGNNPLTKVWNKEEFYYEGYRTPHLYYQTRNFNAASHPNHTPTVRSPMCFMGEYNEQKDNHGFVPVKITGDGVEIFNDNMLMFNGTYYMDPLPINATLSQYQIEVTNDEVFAHGRKMVNHTIIDFDLTQSDANPPALTMLRVIDEEKISMFTNGTNGRLEITAGDFTVNFDSDMIKYDKKPAITVSWSSDGTTFHELTAIEDASKFHPGYGHFYNVSLAPLVQTDLKKETWITIKIVLTDDVGNSMVQILEPLFQYLGETGIEEILSEQASNVAYPNPFTGIVTIELNNFVSGETYFEVYDIIGKIIHQQKMNCSQTTSFNWNGSHLKEGMYFYGIYNQGNVIRGKMVK